MEQPNEVFDDFSSGGARGGQVEHLIPLLLLISELKIK